MAHVSGHTKVSGNIPRSGIAPVSVMAARAVIGTKSMHWEGGNLTGRNATQNLTYPLNVEDDPQQGHYIIFEILKQDKAKLAARKALKSVQGKLAEIKAELNTTDSNLGLDQSGAGDPAVVGGFGGLVGGLVQTGVNAYQATREPHSGPNSLQVARNATVAMPVCIALYMPPSVQVSYGAKYADQEIGVMAESANAAIRAFMNTEGDWTAKTAVAAGTAIGGAASGLANWAKKALPAGGEAIFAINSGSIITPRMELMFEGITRRNFSFSFIFIPKSEQEANVIDQIVKEFKYHMASNYGGLGMGGVDGVREMEIPDFFNIRYMYQGHQNQYLNKIKQCVLQTAAVEYGSDRYKAYAGGRPQTTKLNLSFQELEIITKDYINQGY